MKKIIGLFLVVSSMYFVSCNSSTTEREKSNEAGKESVSQPHSDPQPAVVSITKDDFKKLIYNYDENPKQFVYLGKRPCIIDFYADWCGPCKLISPILEELAQEYKGKVDFYKINTENEKELASVFQVSSIPMVVFWGMNADPQSTVGAYSKLEYKQAIESLLKK